MVATRARRTRVRATAVAGAILAMGLVGAVTACSSSSTTDTGGGAPSTTAAATSPGSTAGTATSEPPGTTEVEPSPEALAANLTAADLGTGWADYPEDAEVLGEDEAGGCVEASGLVDDLPEDATADGEIIQYGDRLVFAQTTAWVFATPEEAQAFAAHLLSDEHVECRRAELERGLPDSDPPLAIASTGTYEGDGTTPYVGAFTYETQQVVDGVAQPAGAGSRHAVYVVGSTVIDLFTQIGISEGDPADLNATTNAMVDAGMATVFGRVAA